MKNSRRNAVALVAGGIILGAAIAAPAAGAALMAQQSSQRITVDGKPVQIEAYSINGNNYCKLRDIGKAVGFNVSYDAASNTVCIKTNEPYSEGTPAQASRVVSLPVDGSTSRRPHSVRRRHGVRDQGRRALGHQRLRGGTAAAASDANVRLERVPDAGAARTHRQALQ